MDLKQRATDLATFLKKYLSFLNEEVLDEYPESFLQYEQPWIQFLSSLNNEELFLLDSKIYHQHLLSSPIGDIIQQLIALTSVEKNCSLPPRKLEDWAYIGVKHKKRHEIDSMAPTIEALATKKNCASIVDIGGGVGHLSRILAHYYDLECFSIDKDAHFQSIGKKRLERFRQRPSAKNVHFVECDFRDDQKNIIKANSFLVGLHTCGELHMDLLKVAAQKKVTGLLSFGCCYHKLAKTKNLFLSTFYQEHCALPINAYALTLACRAHGKITPEAYKIKTQVKYFRAGLHLFFYHKCHIKDCLDVGELKNVKEYFTPFSDYVRKKCYEKNIQHPYTDAEINAFYEEKWVQETLNKMFYLSLFRWQFGRALEIYLLIDRALYLEEHGLSVALKTFFDEDLSPRNIGIISY